MKRQWKLGEDLSVQDNALDQITFDEIIMTLHCNEQVIDERAVWKVVNEIHQIRMQDFSYLVRNNIDEIIALAKEGRE